MLKMEIEARFYTPTSQLKKLKDKLSQALETQYLGNYHELTIMYDNPNPAFSYYNKEIDGRLRLRISKLIESGNIEQKDSILISWNRRLQQDDKMSKAEESEFEVDHEFKDNVLYILENVLRCPRVSSYERERAIYINSKVKHTIDKFPFGCMLEIESLFGNEEDVETAIHELGLEGYQRSALSCDDMYTELCQKAGVKPRTNISFADPNMPTIG